MGQDVLEKELPPALAVELRCPIRKLSAAHGSEKSAHVERLVHDHPDPSVLCQGKKTLGGLTLPKRIVDLEEIELLAPEHLLHLFVLPSEGGRHTHVPGSTLLLRLADRPQVDGGVLQVVHLVQVDDLAPPVSERLLLLSDPHLQPSTRRDLRGEEQVVVDADLLSDLAGHLLRGPIRRSRIEESPPHFVEESYHVAQGNPLRARRPHIKRASATKPHGRNHLPRRGDRTHELRLLLSEGGQLIQ